MTEWDDDYCVDCPACGGSGDDFTDTLGRCYLCGGSGEVWAERLSDDDEADDELW